MSGLGTAVIVLCVAALAALLIRLVAGWMAYQAVLTPDEGLDAFLDRIRPSLVTAIAGAILLVPTSIAVVVTALVWVHRARTNAGLTSPYFRFRHTPGFSVIGLLIPFANVWFLRPILEDICAGSSPYGRDDRGTALVRVCWASTIVTCLLTVVGFVISLAQGAAYRSAGTVSDAALTHDALVGMVLETLLYLLAVATVVAFASVVRHVTRQQTALLFAPRPA